jgi:hypothetical protein
LPCSCWSLLFYFSFRLSILRYHAKCLRHFMALFVAYIWELKASFICDNSIGSWHLEYEVGAMRNCHKMRKHGSPEDRVILGGPVHDFEVRCFPFLVLAVTDTSPTYL